MVSEFGYRCLRWRTRLRNSQNGDFWRQKSSKTEDDRPANQAKITKMVRILYKYKPIETTNSMTVSFRIFVVHPDGFCCICGIALSLEGCPKSWFGDHSRGTQFPHVPALRRWRSRVSVSYRSVIVRIDEMWKTTAKNTN